LPAILFLCYENKGEVITTEFNRKFNSEHVTLALKWQLVI